MTDKPTYYDIRADFWKTHWEMAMTYDEFLQTDPENAIRWHDYDKRAVTASDRGRCSKSWPR